MSDIITARLVLRTFETADAEDLFTIRGDAEAMRHWDWPLDRTIDETRQVAGIFMDEMASGQALYFTARFRDGGFVGIFDLSDIQTTRPDLGFMVSRALWSQGFGYEGASALLEEARRRSMRALKARIHARNEASRRLLRKLGFRREGGARALEVIPGRKVHCEFYGLDLHA